MEKKKVLIASLALLGGLAIMSKKVVTSNPSTWSRGYRNNNPLNIRVGNNWKGETKVNTDGSFEQFENAGYGYRAAAKLILNYFDLYNIWTVEGVINRWAPSVGIDPNSGKTYNNHTENYIEFVDSQSGGRLWRGAKVTKDNIAELVWLMGKFENAAPHPYSLAYVKDAINKYGV